ncbi:hypothetical protein SBY92_001104 [Candida maltosa Xu316]
MIMENVIPTHQVTIHPVTLPIMNKTTKTTIRRKKCLRNRNLMLTKFNLIIQISQKYLLNNTRVFFLMLIWYVVYL